MRRDYVVGLGLTVAAITTLAAAGLVAQAAQQARTAAAVAPAASANSGSVLRTPWGDPDISGVFTNKYEQSTPFERPDALKGKRLEDISSDELKKIVEDRQRVSIARAPFAGGDPEGRIGGPLEWGDRFEITKGSRPWFVVDPEDGKIPPMTPEGQARAARARRGNSSFSNGPFNSVDDLSLYDRCISRGYPGSMLPAIYGNSYQIHQAPGMVAIRYEMIHETRVIPLDGRPHTPSAIRSYMGDARGHWEGDTLVVETTNLRPNLTYRNANSDKLKLVERFTRRSADKLDWTVTVDDPTTWTRPWTFAVPLTANESEPVFEYACHEGNYAVHNMLSASRAAEAAAKK